MTDNEIIKNAELCLNNSKVYSCDSCAYLGDDCDCVGRMLTDLLSLINRQKAEVERLRDNVAQVEEAFIKVREMMVGYKVKLDTAKAETAQEFAETLTERCSAFQMHGSPSDTVLIRLSEIYKIVDEMGCL